MANEGPDLKQVGAAGATIGDTEVRATTGQRKPGQRKRRDAIIGADGGAKHAAGRGIRSQRRIAAGGL
jgi:hypothetical protein